MTILFFCILGILTLVLGITLFNAFTAPRLQAAPRLQTTPLVSVLIPARDEEENLANCLTGLLRQNYPHLEIIVLDDGSRDATAAIARRFVEQDKRVQLLAGEPLPPGWLGKNWACDQLSRCARGEILIFTDADCTHAPEIVTHTVAWMQKLRLGMLTAFSQQVTLTLPEKLIVPVIYMLVYSYLPLWLTYFLQSSSLAAANGQWIAFTRGTYDRIGGHRAVRREVVEDVELSRLAKIRGEKILVFPGTGALFCRMYRSWRGVWEGFSKNAFGLVRFQTAPFFMLATLLFAIHVTPYLFVGFESLAPLAGLAILMNLLLRLILALKYKQPLFTSVILHPVAVVLAIIIGLNSYRWFRAGKIIWKNRPIPSKR